MRLNGNRKRSAGLFVASLMLLDLLICIPFLRTAPIGLDEPFSIFHAQKNLPELFAIFAGENNPPLHFVLLHYWESLFGIGPAAVRSLSLLFSVLTVPVLWQIGDRFFNRSTALIACLLFIFSDFHHFHALEARTYSLLVLEFSILTFLMLRVISEGKQTPTRTWIFLALINAAIFYTHYLFPILLPAEIVALLLFIRRMNIRKALLGTGIFSALIIPWTPILLERTRSVEASGTWLARAQWTELYGLVNKFLNDRWVLVALVATLLLLLVLQRREFVQRILRVRDLLVLLVILFVIPYLLCFLLSKTGGPSLFYDRYLFLLTIPLFTGIGYILSGKESYSRAPAIGFLLVFMAFFNVVPDNHREGDRLAAYVRKKNVKPIFTAPGYYDLNFLYHYDRGLFANTRVRDEKAQYGLYGIESLDTLRVWKPDSLLLIDASYSFTHPGAHPDKMIREYGYTLKEQKSFKGDYTVSVFSR